MHLVNPIQVATVATIVAVITAIILQYRWFRSLIAYLKPTSWSLVEHTSVGPTQPAKGVLLSEVYAKPSKTEDETDVDIIAIHGLDTRYPDTWTWKDPTDPENEEKWVNWLKDLLPDEVGCARIFACNWPADLFEPSEPRQKTFEEFARPLLDSIKRRDQAHRPILFIASCLGGLILMKALVMADAGGRDSDYLLVMEATKCVIFLATPFRGTAFEDVAAWVLPGLDAWALFRGQKVTCLLSNVNEPSQPLQELVCSFTELCRNANHQYKVFTFYERGNTNLLRKAFPWSRSGAKPLVDGTSGTLDIVANPLGLDRNHVMMNKFRGRGDKDLDFKTVAGKITEFLQDVRNNDPDTWIRKHHYAGEKLRIERLSGDTLPMEQCYINLAIVAQSGQDAGSKGDMAPQSSPFSLYTRLKVKTPEDKFLIDLPSLFDPPRGPDGHAKPPRRILIRGRAGVGKTTLCKKIVHDFPIAMNWKALFKRVLWVPLRRLKEHVYSEYNLESLFFHVYFETHKQGRRLAQQLWDAVNAESLDSRGTLFILDGLDEVSDLLDSTHPASGFLIDLLNSPNVIITTRPYAMHLTGLKKPDLELETIGFFPDQVDEYLQKTFSDPPKTSQVKSFLENHKLIQGLVRIPIQLDALCFTWDDGLDTEMKPNTMTAMYRAIEPRLWKKDVVHLKKKDMDGGLLTKDQMRSASRGSVERLVGHEISFLEGLAFTGLHGEMIQFDSEHLNAIIDIFAPGLLPDKTLPCLSFLRSSDPSSKFSTQLFHFLHLTYQEYFAARYFVRQWKSGERLQLSGGKVKKTSGSMTPETAAEFLQKYKYTARYDILWRFVAGLLDAEGRAEEFFRAINEEPYDLLGPAHQRLVMRCLSEVSVEMPLRELLEEKLEEWLLFECKFVKNTSLARVVEFPEQVLCKVLREGYGGAGTTVTVLTMLHNRRAIPSSIIAVVAGLLGQENEDIIRAAADILGLQSNLPEAIVTAIAVLLEDEDDRVRYAAADALGKQSNLPEAIVTAIAVLLEDEDDHVRYTAADALGKQSNLPEAIVTAIAVLLEDEDDRVRDTAANALVKQPNLPEAIVTTIAVLLESEDHHVRYTAANALGKLPNLPEAIVTAIAVLLESENINLRVAAANTLGNQSNLPEAIVTAIAVLLEDEYDHVRRAAADALGEQSHLPEEICGALARLEAFAGQLHLPEVALARLDHKDWSARRAAVEAFYRQSSLPETILAAIVERLNDEHWYVREDAVEVLGRQSSLPKTILAAIVERLKDENRDVRKAAVEVLGRQSSLPKTILAAIVERLKDEDWGVRRAAVKALDSRSSLPETILTAIVERLKDENWDVRTVAVEALKSQSSLPETILAAIVERLNDEDFGVARAAVEALKSQSSLPETILAAIVERLKDEDGDVRRAAVEALGSQSSLPEAILAAIVERLKDEVEMVRIAAARVALQTSDPPPSLLDGPSLEPLYKTLLGQSFKDPQPWIWHVENQMAWIGLPDGASRNFQISDESEFRSRVEKARRDIGAPSPIVEY